MSDREAVSTKDCFHRVFVQWPDGSYISSLDMDFPTTLQRTVSGRYTDDRRMPPAHNIPVRYGRND